MLHKPSLRSRRSNQPTRIRHSVIPLNSHERLPPLPIRICQVRSSQMRLLTNSFLMDESLISLVLFYVAASKFSFTILERAQLSMQELVPSQYHAIQIAQMKFRSTLVLSIGVAIFFREISKLSSMIDCVQSLQNPWKFQQRKMTRRVAFVFQEKYKSYSLR